jgi:hypothetical protein
MPFYDQLTNFAQGADNGQDTEESIQPLVGGVDTVSAHSLNRAVENLRKRIEVLRRGVDDLRYMADYDRAIILDCAGTFQFVEADPIGDPGAMRLNLVGDDLRIMPALTPGLHSGGRARGAKMFTNQAGNWVPYAGVLGVNDISLVASSQYTGQRGYADADNFATDVTGVSLGANRLRVQVVEDPALPGGTITATVSGHPAVNVTITVGSATPTTVAQLVTWINSDTTSQGSYGLANLFRASTTSSGTAQVAPFTGGVFQGGYDAEMYKITPAILAAFFDAMEGGQYPNRLREGEGLAIAFTPGPVERGTPGAKGGRRQSLVDFPTSRTGTFVDNTAPSIGWNLFNTGREPEKIPGSIPIGKMIGGVFVFIDGTIIGSAPLSLTESGRLLARLGSITGQTGASLIGYGGSEPWHGDAATTPNPSVPLGTVESAIDNIVKQLADDNTNNSGTRRIGSEALSGSASTLNQAHSVPAGSIRQTLLDLLNAPATDTDPGGINARVSERGHVLKGKNPITKDLSVLSLPDAGGQRFGALMSGHITEWLLPPLRAVREEFADIQLQPLAVKFAGLDILLPIEPIAAGSAGNRFVLTGPSIATRYPVLMSILPSMVTYREANPLSTGFTGCLIVGIYNISGAADGPGYYFFEKLTNSTTFEFQVRKLDGSVPDFSGATMTNAFAVFFQTFITGTNDAGIHERSFFLGEGQAKEVIALGNDLAPWLEVYRANGSAAGAPAIKTAVHTAKKSVWRPTEPVPRDSDHILSQDDFNALRGIETGTPVDAGQLGNHHHDNTIGFYGPTGADLYKDLVAYNPADPPISLDINPTLQQIQTSGGGLQPSGSVVFVIPSTLLPANMKFSHVIVDVYHQLMEQAAPAGTKILSASYNIAAGSTGFAGVWSAFSAPAGNVSESQNPHLVTYGDGTTTISYKTKCRYTLPIGNYSPTGEIGIRYHNAGFSGDPNNSRVRMRLVGLIKTRV